MKEENKEIRNFIIIFIIVLVAVVGIYFFTKNVVKKETVEETKKEETTEVEINHDSVIVGNMLNKADKHYYVIIYDYQSNNVSDYLNIRYEYTAKEGSLPVYAVDLSSPLNSKFYDPSNINLNPSDIKDYRFGDITVLEVKDGKVVKSYSDLDSIKKAWKMS